jgi:hypothetical protein
MPMKNSPQSHEGHKEEEFNRRWTQMKLASNRRSALTTNNVSDAGAGRRSPSFVPFAALW